MSYVMAAPEMMATAATDLAAVGSTLNAAHLAAAAPTVAVIPAAADEVSASIAHLFSVQAQDYQALAGQAAAFHEQFVQHLTASAASYASAEAANVALLQPLTAIAGSVAGVVTAVQDQVITFLNELTTQLFFLLLPIISIIFILLIPAIVLLIILARYLGFRLDRSPIVGPPDLYPVIGPPL